MNLLEHYIEEIHDEKDITKEYENYTNDTPLEPLLEVDMTTDCYGVIERKKRRFWKSELDKAKRSGKFFS